jgi:hypothetical protein
VLVTAGQCVVHRALLGARGEVQGSGGSGSKQRDELGGGCSAAVDGNSSPMRGQRSQGNKRVGRI